MIPMLKIMLPKSDIAHNSPQAILYGPDTYQGLGLLHPWYHQAVTYNDVYQ